MNKIFAPFLPPWAETGLQPAFYDVESGTVLQQTARMYAKVQQLTRLFNELSEETKTTVEEYIAKFVELKDFVDTYFENLDVQEEINNKLDAMVEDGTLQEIISSYIQSNVEWTFDTVADMQASDNLIAGSYATTLGYYNTNDGGGATYQIIEHDSEVIDGGRFIAISETLTASLVLDRRLSAKQFGATGDGVTDDTNALKALFDTAKETDVKSVYLPQGKYLVTDTILSEGIDGLNILGENDDIYTSSIILRGADRTIFNFSGDMQLTGLESMPADFLMKNITIRDNEDTYTNYPFINFHYTQHFTVENCTISCRNKAIDMKHCYDSRFINTDFTAGGNSTSAMVTIHGGKHAAPDAIGWDSANCITFLACRFERYFGTAVATTDEVQPDTYNTDYDPCVAQRANNIYFSTCRFEAPTLREGNHLKFIKTDNIKLDAVMTILDGQPSLQPILLDGCSCIDANLITSYNRSTAVPGTTFVSFSQPIVKLLNNTEKMKLVLAVYNIYTNYALDYFVDVTAGDKTRRTLDIQVLFSGTQKKAYNQSGSNLNINAYQQGRITRYGEHENGYGLKVEGENNNSYFNNMVHDTVNSRYELQNRYANSSNTNRTTDSYISNDTFTYHKHDCGTLIDGGLVITPQKYPSTSIAQFRSSTSSGRSIMFDTTYPTAEVSGTTFRAGDIIFKMAPTAGSNIGWVCVTTGNPGTWKAFGSIEA